MRSLARFAPVRRQLALTALMAVAAGGSGCAKTPSATSVEVVILRPAATAPSLEQLVLEWRGPDGALLKMLDVPLDKRPAGLEDFVLANVVIDLPDLVMPEERTAVATGFSGGVPRVQGRSTATITPGTRDRQMNVQLKVCGGPEASLCTALEDAGASQDASPVPLDGGADARFDAAAGDVALGGPGVDASEGVDAEPPPDLSPSADQTVVVPNAPAALKATPTASTQVDLIWNDQSNNETGFEIERSLAGENFLPVMTVGSGVTTFSDTGLLPATYYTYRVRAAGSGGGASAYAPDATVTTGVAAGVETRIHGKPSSSTAMVGFEADKAFDGKSDTYFEATDATGGWVGMDAGRAFVITKIRYVPRAGLAARMESGKFQGSTVALTMTVGDLATLSSSTAPPAAGSEVVITNKPAARFLRYLGSTNSYADVAEIEFYTKGP